MLYNQNNLNVSKFASKNDTRPEITGVFITKDKTVATDGFRLVEMSTPTDIKVEDYPRVDGKSAMRGMKPVIINADYMRKKIKIKQNMIAISHIDDNKVEVLLPNDNPQVVGEARWLPRVSGEFPEYDKIFPTNEPKAEIEVNGKWLAEVLDTLSKLNNLNSVRIKFYTDNAPLVLEAERIGSQKARAMLMPLRK